MHALVRELPQFVRCAIACRIVFRPWKPPVLGGWAACRLRQNAQSERCLRGRVLRGDASRDAIVGGIRDVRAISSILIGVVALIPDPWPATCLDAASRRDPRPRPWSCGLTHRGFRHYRADHTILGLGCANRTGRAVSRGQRSTPRVYPRANRDPARRVASGVRARQAILSPVYELVPLGAPRDDRSDHSVRGDVCSPHAASCDHRCTSVRWTVAALRIYLHTASPAVSDLR